MIKTLFSAGLLFFFVLSASAATISFEPATPLQGEPVLVTISASSTVTDVTWRGTPVTMFSYLQKPRALLGIDLKLKPGSYPFRVTFSDGTSVEENVTVIAREKIEAPLGIPEKLGGNTSASAQNLVSTLAAENASFLGLRTFPRVLWTNAFRVPLNTDIVVTDTYGYSRQTVDQTITHKGTDFRAKEGTRVRAMNRGIVRVARTYRNYGKTIVVDHGAGVQTMYMHLSRINVNPGQLVERGEIIGLSGKTGYAESPHLHISVRLNEISIDPSRFLALFGVLLPPAVD